MASTGSGGSSSGAQIRQMVNFILQEVWRCACVCVCGKGKGHDRFLSDTETRGGEEGTKRGGRRLDRLACHVRRREGNRSPLGKRGDSWDRCCDV